MLSGQPASKEVDVWGVLLHIWGVALLVLATLVQCLVVRVDAGLPEKNRDVDNILSKKFKPT